MIINCFKPSLFYLSNNTSNSERVQLNVKSNQQTYKRHKHHTQIQRKHISTYNKHITTYKQTENKNNLQIKHIPYTFELQLP